MAAPRILAFAGSARLGSWNKKLLDIAVFGAQAAGADVTILEVRQYPLPLYDAELEQSQGLPPHVQTIKALMLSHQGFLIASPEYNSAITPLLKNLIDWTSRPSPGEAGLACYTGKTALVVSASPGALGGLRGLVHLRMILGNIGVLVLPGTISIVKAHEAFADDGTLKDSKQQARVEQLGAELAAYLQRHSP
jgi:NAD(P)H-dependent FMN reductase